MVLDYHCGRFYITTCSLIQDYFAKCLYFFKTGFYSIYFSIQQKTTQVKKRQQPNVENSPYNSIINILYMCFQWHSYKI
jgi:hypothetical protein